MTPRSFAVSPDGGFLYAANQGSDSVVTFAIDATTGKPAPTGSTITVAAPAFVGFAPVLL
jgi:YVTN family beta-propeller protein